MTTGQPVPEIEQMSINIRIFFKMARKNPMSGEFIPLSLFVLYMIVYMHTNTYTYTYTTGSLSVGNRRIRSPPFSPSTSPRFLDSEYDEDDDFPIFQRSSGTTTTTNTITTTVTTNSTTERPKKQRKKNNAASGASGASGSGGAGNASGASGSSAAGNTSGRRSTPRREYTGLNGAYFNEPIGSKRTPKPRLSNEEMQRILVSLSYLLYPYTC